MPEYLAPGVYVEEVSFRSKSIEGVSTTTTGFVGPTRYGPITLEPEVITSLLEFERTYGDGQQLVFTDGMVLHNYMWHAARAFFEEGGRRLYVVRTFRQGNVGGVANSGLAKATLPAGVAEADGVNIRARFPGAMGNLRIRITVRLGANVLSGTPAQPTVVGLQDGDVVWISDLSSPVGNPPGTGSLYIAEKKFDNTLGRDTWTFTNLGSPLSELQLEGETTPDFNPVVGSPPVPADTIKVVTLAVTIFPQDPNSPTQVWDNIAPHPGHKRFGVYDSLERVFGDPPVNQALRRTLPIMVTLGGNLADGLAVLDALDDMAKDRGSSGILAVLADADSTDLQRSFDIKLEGGNDGERPGADEYKGAASNDNQDKKGLVAFEDIEDVSIVAAPGSTFGFDNGYNLDARQIISYLIGHSQRMRYRIAVIDSGENQTISQVLEMRHKFDSTYGALYYPWVRVLDPITRTEISLPPSGFIAGIYARNDINRAVYKAPANEVVNSAIGFERLLNKSQQEVLNPEGVNCLRFFEGRGLRVWGARTISSDPEWKYVNLRRYFAYLERSIDRGTQWAVFEPNGEMLWANVRRTIEDFMLNEWQMGALLGDKPEKAYFVKCDRSTMTQNDLDNGRLICLIGVAPLRPAEFVIFRIGQWTADRKV